jgi:hypothetical protein
MNNKNKIMMALSLLVLILAANIAMQQQQYAMAKPTPSIFTIYGETKDKGKQDGINAFKAGLPDEPHCNLGNTLICAVYNGAFHDGWSKAQEVAP